MKQKSFVLGLAVILAVSAFAQAPKSAFFTTSDKVKIHYLDAGSGQAIVLVPGWTMPGWIFQPQIDEFSKKYRVIAVDPRSQGESEQVNYGHLPETRARDYKELVDHLGLKKPVLVGWSMGVGELLKYAEQFGSDNVGGYVLVDGFIWDKPSPETFSAMAGFMNFLQMDRQKQAAAFIPSMFKKPQSPEYLKRLEDASMKVPADTAVVLIYNMIAVKDFTPAVAKVTRPVMFAYTPNMQASADFLKSKLGDNVRLERFGDDGHALFVDDPRRFNRIVTEFVDRLPKN